MSPHEQLANLDAFRRTLGNVTPLPWSEVAETRIDHAVASADEGWVGDDDAARMQAAYDNYLEGCA